MASQASRYAASGSAIAAEGWTIERLTPPSRLYGANGLTTGADGRVYVAQVGGSQVSAIGVDSGAIETISAMGGDIVAPDDLVFDEAGNLYLTEITEGRVCMRTPDGSVRVIQGDMPVANPITWHQGRLIAGECRVGARIMELSLDGGAPRVIVDNVPMANAFQVGPDGKLYFPVMGTNEIWRVSLDGGAPEVVAGDLGVPDSVKFDSKGRIVTTQVASGQVLRIDPVSGAREVLADLGPGLDNVTFVGDRIFVSSIPGEITEILGAGKVRPVVPRALQWPLGLAVGADGAIFVADGTFGYTLRPGSNLELAGMIFYPGCPGYLRGVAPGAVAGEWVVTTGLGAVARYRPAAGESDFLANGYDQLMGVAVAPGGAVVFAEYGTGRVLSAEGGAVRELASGLDKPMGVAIDADGTVYVAEAGAGRVAKLARGKAETVVEGLGRPEGLAVSGGKLFVVDTTAKALITVDAATGAQSAVASNLPVGAPQGVKPKFLGPIGDMAGPMIPFADVTVAADGTLYVAGDGEGSVLEIRAG
ncbi:SMP-30/gluconolactonase/LRE family protein [Sphingomonas cavernae]|uniref:Gluconolaconase n=1 Tax=Sphingomonas cavernae TaxID=2320861 RepID=A0A418WM97_9SPHN|nr:SMP-30/gluconolactonase/LRE family protein [Sphingomonas cavernae]RJF91133.1 gluconolaconase [Sphingomonas cavernae]